MNQLITEDIIKRALDESIEEFMLEEGGGWNNFKQWAGKVGGNLWNGIRNGVANFMNKRTGGQWNQKYGIYADYSNNSIQSKNGFQFAKKLYQEASYFEKWLNTHAKNINDILNSKEGPEYEMYDEYTKNSNGVRTYKDRRFKGTTGATAYIKTYCTYDNFYRYVAQYFPDYGGNANINNYIVNYITAEGLAPQIVLRNMSIAKFNKSDEGKAFYNTNMKTKNEDQKQRVAAMQQAQNARTGKKDKNYNNGGVINFKTGKPFKSN